MGCFTGPECLARLLAFTTMVVMAGCPAPDPPGGGQDAGPRLDGGDVNAPEPTLKLRFEAIATPIAHKRITGISFLPDSDTFLILEKPGDVTHYRMEGDSPVLLGSFTAANVYSNFDCGLLDIAYDPDFATNGLFYLSHCTDSQHSRITRYTWNADDLEAVVASATEIISAGVTEEVNPWHNVGSLGFYEDGSMWSLWGEKTIQVNAQDTSNILGAVVRIYPDRSVDGSGYTIPDDNPFVGDDAQRDELLAYGLRSPWKGHLDQLGRLWIGDVGASDAEEINLLTDPGVNFGWNTWEGPCTSDCDGFTQPITHWPHDTAHTYVYDDLDAVPSSNSVAWVGGEYRDGDEDPYAGLMREKMLFGDMCFGYVRVIWVDEAGELVTDVHVGHLEGVVAWSQATDGYLYAATWGAGCESTIADPTGGIYRAVLDGE